MLEEYALKNGFDSFIHFTDDGFSGGSFDRPSWKDMIAAIEANNISAVIVKDMSRVGRDYLQVGFYTEVFFRERGIRFIAIANGIDSLNWESGERLTFAPIYGYKKDPKNEKQWAIDEEAAAVVRRIFALTIEGKGPTEIARILAEEKIPRPSCHLAEKGIINYTQYDNSIPHAWSGNTVAHIVEKPEYMGHTVNFRTYKDSYKDKKSKEAPKEDWMIFENTHPAIIDPRTWETAQRCRKTVRRTDSLGEANPLTGLVFCADCGAKMYNNRKPYLTTYINEKGFTCTRCPKDIYTCSTYNLTSRRFDR